MSDQETQASANTLAKAIKEKGESWNAQKKVVMTKGIQDAFSLLAKLMTNAADAHQKLYEHGDKDDSRIEVCLNTKIAATYFDAAGDLVGIGKDFFQWKAQDKAPNPALLSYLSNLAFKDDSLSYDNFKMEYDKLVELNDKSEEGDGGNSTGQSPYQ